jgi:large subunit ribosomal protein L4
MPVVKVINRENKPVGEMTLSDKVFAAKINKHLLWEAVQSHLQNLRQGNASTKTRGEVSGGGKKPWKQKGTGRARAGSNRSPLWYHGGVSFGPKPRDYTWEMPKQLRRQAMRCALSAKLADGELLVLDDLKLQAAKTKEMASFLKKVSPSGRTTVVLGGPDASIQLSSRNLKSVRILVPQNINTYDLIDCQCLLLTKAAVTKIEESLSR